MCPYGVLKAPRFSSDVVGHANHLQHGVGYFHRHSFETERRETLLSYRLGWRGLITSCCWTFEIGRARLYRADSKFEPVRLWLQNKQNSDK